METRQHLLKTSHIHAYIRLNSTTRPRLILANNTISQPSQSLGWIQTFGLGLELKDPSLVQNHLWFRTDFVSNPKLGSEPSGKIGSLQ